ncbi:28 kDa heat-and acid-stable phosphoprotein [Pleurostoma richardsiae]|uniref:28 kDa heat-and acid-stable phosphoprotein n=1 Tax=Pleurostoma richardsiae TaxID=41990 RepID=A0AA38RVE6_9PEZI|nr:28 kDa heat-and acid-stable phosphoprotein [Pleurostoma richardsiae]
MAGGGPGTNSRGRGGKFRKFTRGGGKHFSRDLRPLDADGNEISMWSEGAKRAAGADEEPDDDEESGDESEDEGQSAAQVEAATREDRKKERKARKDAAIAKAKAQAVQVGDLPPSDSGEDDTDDDMPANPNHSLAARNQAKAPSAGINAATEGIKGLNVAPQSRRERELLEAQQAKERYRKLQEAGKTDEAKADLARLRVIREKREAEAARKQAEKEEREAQEKAKKAEVEAKEARKRAAAAGPTNKAKGKK